MNRGRKLLYTKEQLKERQRIQHENYRERNKYKCNNRRKNYYNNNKEKFILYKKRYRKKIIRRPNEYYLAKKELMKKIFLPNYVNEIVIIFD